MSDLTQLRLHAHILEKENEAGTLNVSRSDTVKRLLDEHRPNMSTHEIKWCEEVLSGSQRQSIAEHTKTFVGVLQGRRSIRKYKGNITNKQIGQMLEASKFAPSSCNRQPIEFFVTRNKDKIAELSKIKKQVFISEAPVCILAVVKDTVYKIEKSTFMRTYFKHMDCGAAIQNVLLTAEYLNIGACWINIKPTDVSRIREIFDMPKEYDIVALITCGQKAYDVKMPGRKDTVIYNEKWHTNTSPHFK